MPLIQITIAGQLASLPLLVWIPLQLTAVALVVAVVFSWLAWEEEYQVPWLVVVAHFAIMITLAAALFTGCAVVWMLGPFA